jgi:ParB family transcriptional regulator, chromosome partitioning protein
MKLGITRRERFEMQLMKKRGLYEAGKIVYVAVGDIEPNPDQPRKNFEPEALRELAASIARYGILQPLSVRRRRGGGGFELVSGERRLRAAKLVGLRDVPCIVLDVDAQESSILALVENLQRKDLDFIEEAEGLNRLVTQHNYKQEEVARLVGLSQSAVSNKLRLLKLPASLLAMMREVGLTERHARALLRLEDEEEQAAVLEQVIKKNLNVAGTEALIDAWLEKKGQTQPESHQKTLYILKDVRLFLNTLTRGMSMMQQLRER